MLMFSLCEVRTYHFFAAALTVINLIRVRLDKFFIIKWMPVFLLSESNFLTHAMEQQEQE